jgi:O-antigen ligase
MLSVHSWAFRAIMLLMFLSAPLSLLSGLAVLPLFLAAGMTATLLFVVQKGVKPLISTSVAYLLILFLVWMVCTLAWGEKPIEGFYLWLRVAGIAFLGLGLVQVFKQFHEEQTAFLESMVALGTVVALLLLAFEVLTGGLATRGFRAVIEGGMNPFDPNDLNRGLTFMAVMFWPAMLVFYRRLTHRIGASKLVSFIVCTTLWFVFTLLLLQWESLAAFVALLCATLVVLCILLLGKAGMALVGVGTVVTLAMLPAMMGQITPEKALSVMPNPPVSAEHRLYIWDFAIERASERMLQGWGLNSSRHIPGGDMRRVFSDGEAKELLPMHPHNMILQVLLELGSVGLIFVVGLVAIGFWKIYSGGLEIHEKAMAFAMMVSYLVVANLSYNIWQNWWLAAIFLFWAVFTGLLSERKDYSGLTAQQILRN